MALKIIGDDFDTFSEQLIRECPYCNFNTRSLRKLVDYLSPASFTKDSPVGDVVIELSPKILTDLKVQPSIGRDEGFRVMDEKGLPLSYIIELSVEGALVEMPFLDKLIEIADSIA